MYSFIHGILVEVEAGFIVVEAGGVGFEINVPQTVLSELPSIGTEVKIYTHFIVKEDAQNLYGFFFKEDREMFKNLISVSGVGPKGALAILSVLKPADLRMAIVSGDVKSISRAPGIGSKTAQRVILELKDKIEKSGSYATELMGPAGGVPVLFQNAPGTAGNMGPAAEAIDALTVLGYTRSEAARAVSRVELREDMSTEEVLKAALKAIR